MALDELPGWSETEELISSAEDSRRRSRESEGVEICFISPVIEDRYAEMIKRFEGRKGILYRIAGYVKRIID
jgi:hypothetical protein